MNIINTIKHLPDALMGYQRGNPYRNGEFKFIRAYLKKQMIIIDAGANTGYYAKHILELNPFVKIHCFEPTEKTYNKLIINLADKIKAGKVFCNKLGLSNEHKTAEIFIYDELDERNSLHLNPVHKINKESLHKEKIDLTTLSRYASEKNVKEIDFLKIDVEGHETKVIEGASDLIEKKLIKCIQFEYNNNWAAAGFTFENIFNKLNEHGYKFYRLTVWGKVPIKKFTKKLENYKHSNYVAILKNTT